MLIPSFGAEMLGLERVETTFYNDFSIAERFGIEAIKDTFNRAFNEWKNDVKYFTELVMVLNHKTWNFYDTDRDLAYVYNTLWKEANSYGLNHFKGDDLRFYINVLD